MRAALGEEAIIERILREGIDGESIQRIEASPYRVIIVLRNGLRIVVEPSADGNVWACREERAMFYMDCIEENLSLRYEVDGYG